MKITITSPLLGLTMLILVAVKSITLQRNCTGYLKRAADANTVQLAIEQMTYSLKYLQAKGMTKGYTSVFWNTPDENVGFWYNNLLTSYKELLNVSPNASQLEKSNVLMKLRETLIDNGENGDNLTVPDGLSRYPNNLMWGTILMLGIILTFITPFIFYETYYK